jgi:hypothetical protein
MEATAILMVFVLPGIALGAFLILTEKNRSKPWVIEQREAWAIRQREEYQHILGAAFDNPAKAQSFGLICGALWVAAIAAFIALTMFAGIQFSWLVIVAALVIQMLVMASLIKAR